MILNQGLGRPSESVLLQNLDCDAVLKGRVLAFKNDYFVTYSVTTVELELTLFNKRVCSYGRQGIQQAAMRGISFVAFRCIWNVHRTTNKQDEVAYQMIDAVSRRL